MQIADLPHGRTLVVELVPLENKGFSGMPTVGSEVQLVRSGDLMMLLWAENGRTVSVNAAHPQQERELARLLDGDIPRVCWLAAANSGKSGGSLAESALVQIHCFSERVHLPEVEIGIDEKLVEDLARQLQRRISIEAAREWMGGSLLLPGIAQAQEQRAIIIGRPRPDDEHKQAFRILGNRYALDVEKTVEGAWRGFRVTRPRSAVEPDENRPLILAQGIFRFVDATVAGKMRAGIATELDQLVRDAGSYMGIWREYQVLEEKRILDDARRFGWLSYQECSRLPDGRWRFALSPDSEWTPDQLREAATGDAELEASSEVPEILLSKSSQFEDQTATNPPWRKQNQSNFVGQLAGMDQHNLLLRSDRGEEQPSPPPERGYIHVCLRGDLKRIQRRREAYNRIDRLQTPLPQLKALLENRSVPTRRVKAYEAMSAAARAKFGSGSPTARQVEAIAVALNTPDVAVIQGPPGTGKTRTIAAIIERLTEIAKQEQVAFDRALLTSFQHDAVENAAAITQIIGLPAKKIGRRRGKEAENLALHSWTQKTISALESDLAFSSEKPLRRLLDEIRLRHIAYVQSPGTDRETAEMLADLERIVRQHVPAELQDRLTGMASRLRLGQASLSDSGREAITVLRGLRTESVSFSDDGPKMAWRLLHRLESSGILRDEDRQLLLEAQNWDGSLPISFLSRLVDLKTRLLADLQSAPPPTQIPLANIEVVALLDAVVDALEVKLRGSSLEGPALVTEEFLQDLKHDPRGLQEGLERYSVVLAATCQQAVGSRMAEILSDDVEFDNVIVDEAARANPLDLLIPLSRASRRVILVGDHRQLPHLLEPEVERQLEQSVRAETREAIRKSLFERLFLLVKRLEEKDGIKRWVTLDTQYRMHPELASFVSREFYEREGRQEGFGSPDSAAKDPRFVHGLRGIYAEKLVAWKNFPLSMGCEERRGYSWRRFCEAEWIASEARRLLEEAPHLSIGVISFYTAQVDVIKEAMLVTGLTRREDDGSVVIAEAWRRTANVEGEERERLRVGTVDAFQGKEFDLVLLSLTRSNRESVRDEKSARRKYGHLLLENRLCVAMSRQRQLLVLVGDAAMAEGEPATKNVPALQAFLHMCRGSYGNIF